MTAGGEAPGERRRNLLGRLRAALPRLDALLRAEGMAAGPDRWQNACDLLVEMQARGGMPPRAAELQPWLAPLFCRDAGEQARFARAFERWLEALEQQPGAVAERPPRRRPPPPEPPPVPRLRGLVLGLCAGVAALALLGYGLERYLDEPVEPEPDGIQAPEVPVPTGPDADAATPEAIELQPLPPRRPLPQPELEPDSQDLLRAAAWLLPLLPAFAILGWLGARWLFWGVVLRRRPGREGVPLHAITLDAPQDELFDAPELREALRRLHTPVPVPTRRLDAGATVRATARQGGLFRPVRRWRRRVPDCVVLVDHAHGADQMAGLALHAVERLRHAGLELARYDYRRDPRRLMGEDGRWHALAQVAARHEGSRLLVIGEPASLINPMSGAVYGWTGAVELLPRRGLLSTRRPPPAWRAALAQRGFLVAELGSDGLSQAAAWFSPAAAEPPAVTGRAVRPLPPMLQDDERWLAPVPPPEDEREALAQALRAYLGREGLLLLAAMAAYPQLHWGLTRALDLGLAPDDPAPARERRLLAVARLPWCRGGGLPDWLREAFLDGLERDDAGRVARLYRWLLNEAEVNGRGRISLPVALPEPEGRRRRLRYLRRLKRWLRARRQVSDRYDPLNDRVFAELLLGRRRRLLDIRLPRRLARLLGRRAGALLRRLAVAAVFTLAAGWGVQGAWERWGRAQAGDWLLARQLQAHEGVTVQVWHSAPTEAYAIALAETLEAVRFQVRVEPRELSLAAQVDKAKDGDARPRLVNAVQWSDPGLREAAVLIGARLAHLAWGEAPAEVGPGADPPLAGPGLNEPPGASRVRVLLPAPPEDRTGFTFRDALRAGEGEVEQRVTGAGFRDALEDGGLGPEMIELPGGSFMMGSPVVEAARDSDEGPRHEVRIPPFAIGRTEVTFEDYDRFAEATGRDKPGDRGWGRGRRPVINVSWNDAVAYAEWLSEQTGERYRLPSEAEWEYAARAGTQTPFWTGECIHTDRANYDGDYDYNDCGAETGVHRAKTVEAGSLPANPWGLHETAGNVWEWVEDCWHESYEGAPADGSAWEDARCGVRVVRGGGWYDQPEGLRSAYRDRSGSDDADYGLGFRLARAL